MFCRDDLWRAQLEWQYVSLIYSSQVTVYEDNQLDYRPAVIVCIAGLSSIGRKGTQYVLVHPTTSLSLLSSVCLITCW